MREVVDYRGLLTPNRNPVKRAVKSHMRGQRALIRPAFQKRKLVRIHHALKNLELLAARLAISSTEITVKPSSEKSHLRSCAIAQVRARGVGPEY